MQRKRKFAVALAWLFPVFFVLLVAWLIHMQWMLHIGLLTIAFLSLGPLVFTGVMSYLLLDQTEDRDVRYARASRRMSMTTKCAALAVVVIGFPALFVRVLLSGYLMGLGLFLFAAMFGLTLAAIVFRLMQHHSLEPGGARDAVIVTTVIFVLAWFFVPAAARSRDPEPRPTCANHLKQLGLVGKMFANDHDGLFPELSSRPGFLSMMNMSEGYSAPIMPEYVSDASILFCPSSERWKSQEGKFTGTEQQLLDDSSYVYLGYAIKNERELETSYQCYKERVAAGLPFDEDLTALPGRGSGGGDKLLRLREGVEKVYVTDSTDPAANAKAQSEIPFLIERLGNHQPTGMNILYLDGHVAFSRYPGEWPATPRTFQIINSLEAMRQQNSLPD